MALIDYSDSESEAEAPAQAPQQRQQQHGSKPAFQKAAPGKIAVSLPSLKPEPGQKEETSVDGPPAKRARTAGAFGGFNSFLPAPKKTGGNAPKAGISLKTSSEAAFSRNPVPKAPVEEEDTATNGDGNPVEAIPLKSEPVEEPKLVGKNTRFLPLSVSNKKKKKPANKPPQVTNGGDSITNGKQSDSTKTPAPSAREKASEPTPKPKRSLFSVAPEEESPHNSSRTGEYEPLLVDESRADAVEDAPRETSTQPATTLPPSNPNTLEAVAADMNLTPAQRRQLFGRHGGKDISVAHFNIDSEYASNEQMRQAGEVVEHRAVKAVAPGKHSLQQLVNNARTQESALADKWSEGRRARGEGGSKYGWSG